VVVASSAPRGRREERREGRGKREKGRNGDEEEDATSVEAGEPTS